MGIDIRDGQQLECITCALCIDACDDVMEKIGKPRGLIDYIAPDRRDARARGQGAALDLEACLPPAHDHLHLALVGGRHRPDVALFIRSDIDVTVAPVRNPNS
jgi:polyferredoxin